MRRLSFSPVPTILALNRFSGIGRRQAFSHECFPGKFCLSRWLADIVCMNRLPPALIGCLELAEKFLRFLCLKSYPTICPNPVHRQDYTAISQSLQKMEVFRMGPHPHFSFQSSLRCARGRGGCANHAAAFGIGCSKRTGVSCTRSCKRREYSCTSMSPLCTESGIFQTTEKMLSLVFIIRWEHLSLNGRKRMKSEYAIHSLSFDPFSVISHTQSNAARQEFFVKSKERNAKHNQIVLVHA